MLPQSFYFCLNSFFRLRSKFLNGKGIIVNIGDGLVDANASPATDAFIGFCGVTHKEKALKEAMMVVDNFKDLYEIVYNSLSVCFFTSCHIFD